MAEFRKEEMVHRLRDLESRMSRLRTAWGSVAKDIAQTINRAFGDTRAIAQVPEELEPEQYLEVRIGGRDLRIVFRMVDTDSTNTGATAAGDLLGAILFQEMAIGPTGERKPIPIAIDGLLLNEQGDWREQSSPAGKFFLGDALPASILSSLSEYVLKAQPKLTGNDLKPPMSQNVLWLQSRSELHMPEWLAAHLATWRLDNVWGRCNDIHSWHRGTTTTYRRRKLKD